MKKTVFALFATLAASFAFAETSIPSTPVPASAQIPVTVPAPVVQAMAQTICVVPECDQW